MENRSYLDLNRNGLDDPNGLVPEINSAGTRSGNIVFEVGDPDWIGVLEHPDQPPGLNNPYIARFAFMAQPAGNSLDWNAIHNQALSTARRSGAIPRTIISATKASARGNSISPRSSRT